MIPYIIKAGLILAGCLVFYKILLRRETFYRINRHVLTFCLFISFSLPLVPVPQQLSMRKSVDSQQSTVSSQQSAVSSQPLTVNRQPSATTASSAILQLFLLTR